MRDELKPWTKWTPPARRYLDEAPKDIDLAEMINGYTARVVTFNDWFGAAFVAGHLAALNELKTLEEALAAAHGQSQ